MEEWELEEGEACSYHDNRGDEDYYSSIDPDVALSYIVWLFSLPSYDTLLTL